MEEDERRKREGGVPHGACTSMHAPVLFEKRIKVRLTQKHTYDK
jgi:hypothetical protein